jgi:hypothetical protein
LKTSVQESDEIIELEEELAAEQEVAVAEVEAMIE